MADQQISTGYVPRPHQSWIHRNLKRFNVLPCHRRFGKTYLAVNEIVDRGLRCTRKNPRYYYVAPTYSSAKRIAWEYVKDATRVFPGVTTNESELRVDIPRGDDYIRIQLLGAENPGNLKGVYADGVIFDEYAETDPVVWKEVFRPALSDRLGWAIFIFTPKGANHAHELYRMARQDTSGEWFAALFKASDTKVIPQKELDAARHFMGEDMYQQEYEVDFTAALVGAYYKHEMGMMLKDKRITKVPHDTHCPVMTGWDLGIDDSTAIWFIQQTGRELHAIDYLEVTGRGLPWIVAKIQEKKYNYSRHFLPHDAAARELGTGKTRIETLGALGLKGLEVVKRQKVEDGIHATRGVLDRLWMDQDECGFGIEALKSYERVFDSKEGVYSLKPKHNWASHGADAMRTFALGFRGDSKEVGVDLQTTSESDYDILGWR